MVPGSHMGRLLCPRTPLKNKISANSRKSGKLVQALAYHCVFPIALGALVALFPLFGVYDGFMEPLALILEPWDLARSTFWPRDIFVPINVVL